MSKRHAVLMSFIGIAISYNQARNTNGSPNDTKWLAAINRMTSNRWPFDTVTERIGIAIVGRAELNIGPIEWDDQPEAIAGDSSHDRPNP